MRAKSQTNECVIVNKKNKLKGGWFEFPHLSHLHLLREKKAKHVKYQTNLVPFFSCSVLNQSFCSLSPFISSPQNKKMALQIQTSTTIFKTPTPSTAADALTGKFFPGTVAVRREMLTVWRGVRCSSGGIGGDAGKKKTVPNSNYVVPLDKFSSSSSITRPLIEILRDLNKKIPDNIVKSHDPGSSAASSGFIPWYSIFDTLTNFNRCCCFFSI